MIRLAGNSARFLKVKSWMGNGSYLGRLIWIGCITVCVPVILASTIYYQMSKHRLEQHIESESQTALMAVKDQVETFLQTIEQNSHDLSLDPELNRVDYIESIRKDPFTEHLNILSAINIKKNSNSLISEIYYYNIDEQDNVLSNYYGSIPTRLFDFKQEIEWHMAGSERTYWHNVSSEKHGELISFVRKLPMTGANAAMRPGLLVFHMEALTVNKHLFREASMNGLGRQFIVLDEQNTLYLSSLKQSDGMGDTIRKQTMERLSLSAKSSGSFKGNGVDGGKASITYMKNAFGRTYIAIVPEQMISERLNWIRISTILVLLFVVSVGMILTYFSSKRIYSPIEQLLNYGKWVGSGKIPAKANEFEFFRECFDYFRHESEKFAHYVDTIEPTLRERCIQQLLNGEYLRNESLLSDCHKYGIPIQAAHAAIVVELSCLEHENRFLPKDKPILTYAVTNVMQELLQGQKHISGYVVSLNGNAAALLQLPQEYQQPLMVEMIKQFAQSVHAALKQVLRIDVSIGAGRLYIHIADLPISYQEAQSALQYKLFKESEPVLFIEEMENDRKQTYHSYPKEWEHVIVDSLKRGEQTDAEHGLAKFSEVLQKTQSYNSVYQSYFLLLSAIISSLEPQGGLNLEFLESDWFHQLKSKHTSRDIYHWFKDTLFPGYRWMSEDSRNATSQSLIAQVCQYIRSNCMQDISLVQCSAFVGISPSYLSRLFKKELGVNFLDYVMECKMEEAQRLLLNSGMTVAEVAAKIGYSDKSLKRLFQKQLGMTPSMFRMKHR